jgi:hypothetical protein
MKVSGQRHIQPRHPPCELDKRLDVGLHFINKKRSHDRTQVVQPVTLSTDQFQISKIVHCLEKGVVSVCVKTMIDYAVRGGGGGRRCVFKQKTEEWENFWVLIYICE